MALIYRQEIIQDITLFTSAPKAKFYDRLFESLDLSDFPESTATTGRNGYSKRALLRAFIVMKCECFSCVTDLLDYLQNNLLIAHYCGFNIGNAAQWRRNPLPQITEQVQCTALLNSVCEAH